MKKIYTLFLTALVLFALQSSAQTSPNCNLTVSFTSAATPNGPNVIAFTNTSMGYTAADTIQWTFGDGTTSSLSNPTHTYTTGATYHVCLTIRRAIPPGTAPCAGYSCHDLAITVACTLTASFNSQPSTSNPLGVYFTNTSAGYASGDSLVWSFGDGTYAYNTATPYHAYANAGTYTVCLHVRKASTGSTPSGCVSDICHSVTVTAPFVCNLSVSYTYAATPNGPNVIMFTNTSTGYAAADTIQWTFGDGTTSSVSNPVHTYTTAGTYHVCLIIKRVVPAGTAACANYSCHDIVVTLPCNLTASFTSQPSTSNPLGVYFTNTSAGYAAGDSLVWSFGDGTYAYNTATPYHAYANAGTYNVCLHVRKASAGTVISTCVSDICHTVTVTAPCTLTASFTSQAAQTNPLGIQFTNTSTGFAAGDSTVWNFGDGTVSYSANPYHVYANAGTYTVCLHVRKASTGSTPSGCVSDICHSVTVTAPFVCNLSVSYTYAATPNGPNVIMFTNTSTGYAAADTIQWTFGDGTTSSVSNPVHTYTTAGTYHVCLIIKRVVPAGTAACANYSCHDIVVTLPCNLTASFTSQPSTSNPLGVYFTNTSAGYAAGDSLVWSFGDGTYAYNTATPYHAYANAGTYTVCLHVRKASTATTVSNCVSDICHTVTVTAPCNLSASFVSQTGGTTASNIVYFNNTSTGYAAGDSILWNFGDGTTSNTSNPVHTYAAAGTYHVCLTVSKHTASGTAPCTSTTCHDIVISLPVICNIHAIFTAQPDGNQPGHFIFTNTSTGTSSTDSATWTFGDGSSAHTYNADHAYTANGNYTVCLHMQNHTLSGTAICADDTCIVISVTLPPVCTVQSNYTYTAAASNSLLIYFTNTTTPAPPAGTTASTTWYFGDGSTATTLNASHQYAQAGVYNVCLRTQYGTCVSYHCDSVHVVAPSVSCAELANFHQAGSSSPTSLSVAFVPNNIYTDVTYTWTFGDGTGSITGPTATHHYTTPGYYTVCLTAYRNSNCASTSCQIIGVAVNTTSCSNTSLGFVTTTDPVSLNHITFTAASNSPLTDQVWTITRVPAGINGSPVTIHGMNPTYAFSDTGTYYVCLHATFTNGCIKDYCNTIHVTFPTPGANACSLQLYPNPATGAINALVTLAQPLVITATVYNTLNMQVLQHDQQGVIGLNTVNLNITGLAAGVYTMRVIYGNQVCYATFIKQ